MRRRQSISGLMDEAASSEIQEKIRQAIVSNGSGAIEAHDIRTRSTGQAVFIEFHLVVPGEMTVSDAHDICDRLESELQHKIKGADVVIHLEPEDKAKGQAADVIDF